MVGTTRTELWERENREGRAVTLDFKPTDLIAGFRCLLPIDQKVVNVVVKLQGIRPDLEVNGFNEGIVLDAFRTYVQAHA